MTVLIIIGLPGSGKTTVIKFLQKKLEIEKVISTDIVRKEVFAHYYHSPLESDLYEERNIQIIYNVINLLLANISPIKGIILIEGTYHLKSRRKQLMEVLHAESVEFIFLELIASDTVIEDRMIKREASSESDARIEQYYKIKSQAEYGQIWSERYYQINTQKDVQKTINEILSELEHSNVIS